MVVVGPTVFGAAVVGTGAVVVLGATVVEVAPGADVVDVVEVDGVDEVDGAALVVEELVDEVVGSRRRPVSNCAGAVVEQATAARQIVTPSAAPPTMVERVDRFPGRGRRI